MVYNKEKCAVGGEHLQAHDIVIVLSYLSVIVLFGCTAAVSTHTESRMQKLALMVCVCLTCCSLGFLFRVEAQSAEGLIAGQKLVYMFVPHSMFLMLLFILEYCGYTMPKHVRSIFHGLDMLISLTVVTLDHHSFFYKSYWAVDMGGYAVLEKEYGPIHTLAVGLFGFYMAVAVLVTLYFAVKNYRRRGYVLRLALAVAVPCVVYIIPKLLDWETDLQPVAFAVFALLVIGMIYRYNLYDVDNIAASYSIKSMSDALIILDGRERYRGCNEKAKELFPVLDSALLDSRLNEELPLLEEFLSGERKEYAANSAIYDVSVRSINGNTGKVLWFRDVTLERNYTRLLQSQVDTLYTYSYMDELTGLQNRRSFEETLADLRAAPAASPLTVAVLDLNGLKTANDTIGHNAGDTLLKGAAAVMKEVFSEGEIFRTGGDEFFVLLWDCRQSEAELEAALCAAMDRWDELPDKLSISYGFASSEGGRVNVDELMSRADRAMYETKRRYYEQSGTERRKK